MSETARLCVWSEPRNISTALMYSFRERTDTMVLLMDPPAVLTWLCETIGITRDPAMLSWEAGPIPEDGVWVMHWYTNTHTSTRFNPFVSQAGDLPPHLENLASECAPMYKRWFTYAIRPDSP